MLVGALDNLFNPTWTFPTNTDLQEMQVGLIFNLRSLDQQDLQILNTLPFDVSLLYLKKY